MKDLRGLRTDYGLSLRQLAEGIESSVQHLSSLERGMESLGDNLADRLAQFYGVTASEIRLRYQRSRSRWLLHESRIARDRIKAIERNPR